MYCKHCGAEIEDDASVCPNCGKKVHGGVSEKKNVVALIAFLLTIVSWFWDYHSIIGGLGFILCIVALVIRKSYGKWNGFAVAGIVCSVIGLILLIIGLIVGVTLFAFLASLISGNAA